MMDSQIPDTIVLAVEAITSGAISSRELTEECIKRAEKYQPELNCFISLQAEKALETAEKLNSARIAGHATGALHGVPMAHKDMYYRVGEISTCGSKIRKNFNPTIPRQ